MRANRGWGQQAVRGRTSCGDCRADRHGATCGPHPLTLLTLLTPFWDFADGSKLDHALAATTGSPSFYGNALFA